MLHKCVNKYDSMPYIYIYHHIYLESFVWTQEEDDEVSLLPPAWHVYIVGSYHGRPLLVDILKATI